jgi:hypothetical protein
METIDILPRINPLDHFPVVDLRGQGELDENSVDLGVSVQSVDRRQELAFGHVTGQPEKRPAHPGGLARILFVPDVNLAGGVVSDQNDGQARNPARLLSKLRDVARDLVLDLLSQRLTVEDAGRQRTFLRKSPVESGSPDQWSRTIIMVVVSVCLQTFASGIVASTFFPDRLDGC